MSCTEKSTGLLRGAVLLPLLMVASGVLAQAPTLDELLNRADQTTEDAAFQSTRADWMRLCKDEPTRELEREALALAFGQSLAESNPSPGAAQGAGEVDEQAVLERLEVGPDGPAPEAPAPKPSPQALEALRAARAKMLETLEARAASRPCLHWARAFMANALGLPVVAAEALDRVPERPKPHPVHEEMARLRAEVLGQVGTIVIRALSPETTVAVDGAPERRVQTLFQVPRGAVLRLAPGSHDLALTMPGHRAQRELSLHAGQVMHIDAEPQAVAQQVDNELAIDAERQAAPAVAASSQGFGVWPYVAFGAAGAATVVGIAAALKAAEREGVYNDNNCARFDHRGCGAVKSEQHQATALQVVSLVAAGTLVGIGVGLLLLESDDADETTANRCTPFLGQDNGVSCRLHF